MVSVSAEFIATRFTAQRNGLSADNRSRYLDLLGYSPCGQRTLYCFDGSYVFNSLLVLATLFPFVPKTPGLLLSSNNIENIVIGPMAVYTAAFLTLRIFCHERKLSIQHVDQIQRDVFYTTQMAKVDHEHAEAYRRLVEEVADLPNTLQTLLDHPQQEISLAEDGSLAFLLPFLKQLRCRMNAEAQTSCRDTSSSAGFPTRKEETWQF